LRLIPELGLAFQPLGFLLPVQAAAITQKNAVKSVSGSTSAHKRAQNVVTQIVLDSSEMSIDVVQRR
jgi:hypothetical protein